MVVCTSCNEHVGTSTASAGRTQDGGASSGSAAAARTAVAGRRAARAFCLAFFWTPADEAFCVNTVKSKNGQL
jgi:hypothetical protein